MEGWEEGEVDFVSGPLRQLLCTIRDAKTRRQVLLEVYGTMMEAHRAAYDEHRPAKLQVQIEFRVIQRWSSEYRRTRRS
jgi:hypothetical protein